MSNIIILNGTNVDSETGGLTNIIFVPELNQLWGRNGVTRVARFNNPNDLSDFDVITLPQDGKHEGGYDIQYNAAKNRIYVNSTNDLGWITEIHPVTMAITDIIQSVAATFNQMQSFTWDDTHFYVNGFTNTSQVTKVRKYLLSDFSIVDTQSYSDFKFGWKMRHDNGYLYIANDIPDPAQGNLMGAIKINAADMTSYIVNHFGHTEHTTNFMWGQTPTDMWLSVEVTQIVSKSNLSVTEISLGLGPLAVCAGTYYDGESVWGICDADHTTGEGVNIFQRINPVAKEVIANYTASPSNVYIWDLAFYNNFVYVAYELGGLGGDYYVARVGVEPISPDTTPPVVTIYAPSDGSFVQKCGVTRIITGATDDVGVAKIEIYVNDVLRKTCNSDSCTYSWKTKGIANGTYTIKVVATDTSGNEGEKTITVRK